jgi:7-cyano-7-deazaguanine reductase
MPDIQSIKPSAAAENAASDTASLTLLGQPVAFPERPELAKIETFANRTPERDYWVTIETSEFSSLCPVTGQPDYAHLHLRYVPGPRCLETKSLKLYLAAFRSVASFNEDIVNRILTELVAACEPKLMVVRGRFSPRGGLQLSCEARYPAQRPAADFAVAG